VEREHTFRERTLKCLRIRISRSIPREAEASIKTEKRRPSRHEITIDAGLALLERFVAAGGAGDLIRGVREAYYGESLVDRSAINPSADRHANLGFQVACFASV
jgi:hypothetical protein